MIVDIKTPTAIDLRVALVLGDWKLDFRRKTFIQNKGSFHFFFWGLFILFLFFLPFQLHLVSDPLFVGVIKAIKLGLIATDLIGVREGSSKGELYPGCLRAHRWHNATFIGDLWWIHHSRGVIHLIQPRNIFWIFADVVWQLTWCLMIDWLCNPIWRRQITLMEWVKCFMIFNLTLWFLMISLALISFNWQIV